jgi:hypothetical protein
MTALGSKFVASLEASRDDFVFVQIQGVDDRFGGTQRNLMFA